MSTRLKGNQELTSVCIGAAVGHGERPPRRVAQHEIFVEEGSAVDGRGARAVGIYKVSRLNHEFGYQTIEDGGVLVSRSVAAADW